jgi:hypothetical protein
MAFRHFNNQKSTSGNHQSKWFPNSVQSAWREMEAGDAAFMQAAKLGSDRVDELSFVCLWNGFGGVV